MKAGIKGYLVQTGKYQPGDEHKICTTPDAVVPSFVEAVEKILLEIKQ
jgi:ribonucleotide monophosphatase NagD (HAD superfamily)